MSADVELIRRTRATWTESGSQPEPLLAELLR